MWILLCHSLSLRFTKSSSTGIEEIEESFRSVVSTVLSFERIPLLLFLFSEDGIDDESLPDVPDRSFQSILSCSFVNQGCNGGYPFLVGKVRSY